MKCNFCTFSNTDDAIVEQNYNSVHWNLVHNDTLWQNYLMWLITNYQSLTGNFENVPMLKKRCVRSSQLKQILQMRMLPQTDESDLGFYRFYWIARSISSSVRQRGARVLHHIQPLCFKKATAPSVCASSSACRFERICQHGWTNNVQLCECVCVWVCVIYVKWGGGGPDLWLMETAHRFTGVRKQ